MTELRAPAKINLRLAVLAREVSGWHQIETLFARLDLADRILLDNADAGIRLTVDGPDLGPTEENLVYRAARAFHAAANIAPAVSIHLVKNIPAGSGLGGGSSDAAAVLLGLDRMRGEPLGDEGRHRVGRAIGADVAFFLTESPFALAWGRGERVLPLSPPPDLHCLLAMPATAMSTARAYARLAEHRVRVPAPALGPLPSAGVLSSWDGIRSFARNDFEAVVLGDVPAAARALDLLRDGSVMAQLSGSGSAVFGLFQSEADAESAGARVRSVIPDVRLIRCRTHLRA
jgi:4-diphosphocytidyl-2-C-methyl-D-erythritol kinase